MRAASLEPARAGVAARLRERRGEIERAALARVHAISELSETADPEYVEGLRGAVAAAIEYGLDAVEAGEERSPAVPPVLLAQARLAARNGVNLDTVLRRYFAGYALLGDFLLEGAEGAGFSGEQVKELLRAQATHFDCLLMEIGGAHTQESTKPRIDSVQSRRAEHVRGLLAGDPVDPSQIAYDFEGCHVGVVAIGDRAEEILRELATVVDRHLLLVCCDDGTIWGWLGGRTPVDVARQVRHVSAGPPSLAVGEPAEGFAGWRLTHRQARATLPVALRTTKPVVRYRDVAILIAVLSNDLLSTSLRQLYLAPLAGERDGGEIARKTLCAYFETGRNVSSAAAVLGVNRRTVTNRLRALEDRIGCTLDECSLDFEMALRFDELDPAPA